MNFNNLKGVIHVGASTGQETKDSGINFYDEYGLNVIWVEPIYEVFQVLQENIKNYPKQKAVNALITDKDDEDYEFYISSNNGESSSIFELGDHKEIWPQVNYVNKIKMKSKTLTTLVKDIDIDINDYDLITLDTQGSELLVLKGSLGILNNIKYVNMEVADFDSYKGCCKLDEVDKFFEEHNYERIGLTPWGTNSSKGDYYDALYVKK